MNLVKLITSFALPIGVAIALFHPNSDNLGRGLALGSTILFCTATAIETFTQD